MRSIVVLFSWILIGLTPLGVIAADHTTDSLEKVKEQLAAKKAILVDVREQVEWDAGT